MASHIEVAHRWAQALEMSGSQFAKGLRGFNMFSDGPSIFSYGRHFEIARIVESPNAGRVVLFTRDSRSISTSKHISYTWRAIGYGNGRNVFRVVSFDVIGTGEYQAKEHARNLEAFVCDAIESQKKASRARTHVQMHLDKVQESLAEAEGYARAFGLAFDRPALSDLSARAAEMAAREKLARETAAREQAQRQAAHRALDLDAFTAWQASAPGSRCPHSYSQTKTGGAYLRRSPDGESLQTSQGAAVPWEHALKAFRFVKLVRERGEAWERNGRQVRVGHYQLDRINTDGSFNAGCHRIEWPEIERLALAQGVYSVAPSAEAVTITEGAH